MPYRSPFPPPSPPRSAAPASRKLGFALAGTAVFLATITWLAWPRLHEDEAASSDVVYIAPPNRYAIGEGVAERFPAAEGDERLVRIDETEIAMDAEPESEVLGTSARTARVVEKRRREMERPIAGRGIRLLTPR